MSQPSSPARAPEPPRQPANAPPGGGGQAPRQPASDQAWKIAALAVALVVLALLLFILFTGATVDQTSAPEEAEYAEEEEAEEPAHAPPPPAMADDPRPRPSAPPPSRSSEGSSQQAAPLPTLNVLSVGYSPMPALRVVALRIGGALPYFLKEGDTIGAIKVLAIMQDRVHISHNGKKYEIRVGGDGQPIGQPKPVR
jgi:hypothetical protein